MMKGEIIWTLIRNYFPEGTNGALWCGQQLLCHTIELPWNENRNQISCIPEGEYQLTPHLSKKFGQILEVQDVEFRSNILIHPANDALEELKGCIAPVLVHCGEGRGLNSRIAMQQLMRIAQLSYDRTQSIFLFIHSKNV